MAFKLKHFLAGAAREATNINEERRKRAMEMIQASMEMQGKSILESREARNKEIKEMEIAASRLSTLGLSDAQINRVLREGVDFAKDFVEKAPVAAKAKGVTPDTFVTIADPDAPMLSPTEYIRRGEVVGRTEVGSFKRVEGLPTSIFGGTFDTEQDQTMKQYASTLGVEGQPAQERISAPEGTIDLMGMLPGGEPTKFGLTTNTVFKNFTNELAPLMGMQGGIDPVTKEYIWKSEMPERNAKYQSAIVTLNILADQEAQKMGTTATDTEIMQAAAKRLRQEFPQFFEDTGDASSVTSGGAGTGGNALQQALAKGSPAQVAAVLSRDPENAGKDVQAMAKELLDQYKGSAAAGAK